MNIMNFRQARVDFDNDETYNVLVNKEILLRDKIRKLNGIKYEIYFITSNNHYINLNKETKERVTLVSETELSLIPNSPSVIILLNSNIGYIGPSEYINFYNTHTSVLVITHDLDNHHWTEMSSLCCMYSDIYVPAHNTYYPWYDFLNENTLTGIPGGALRYPTEIIRANERCVAQGRALGPVGIHFEYPQFPYRNYIVKVLGETYPGVRLRQRESMTPDSFEEQLGQWTKFKTHWIAPVGGDLPTRLFDALCTGGIPIIPVTLDSHLRNLGVPHDDYCVYKAFDIDNPEKILLEAEKKFSKKDPYLRALENSKKYSYDAFLNKILHQIEIKIG